MLHRDKHWQHMDNLQLQTACPNYQSHLRLSAGVTCCSHALQCTGASIPPCISSAEHLNWGSAPRDRNSELRKSTAKHLPPTPQGGKAQKQQNTSCYRSKWKSAPPDLPQRGTSDFHLCCISRGPAAWVAQKASQHSDGP